MKPYYDDGRGIVIYHGDCRRIVPALGAVDLIVTDPPYPTYLTLEYRYSPEGIDFLDMIPCRQFVFWTPARAFPLTYTGKRIWDKKTGTATQYEEIYERGGASGYKIHRHYSMACFSSVGARMCKEIVTGHPSQKPLRLIKELIQVSDARVILDPFMGSGTTLRAAKDLGRQAIGIEIEERYCEIAAKRLSQEVMDFSEVSA